MITKMIEYIKFKYYRRLWLKHASLAKLYDDVRYRHAYNFHQDVADYFWKKCYKYLRKNE